MAAGWMPFGASASTGEADVAAPAASVSTMCVWWRGDIVVAVVVSGCFC